VKPSKGRFASSDGKNAALVSDTDVFRSRVDKPRQSRLPFMCELPSGFDLAVTRESEGGAGDDVTLLSHDPGSASISEITQLCAVKQYDPEDAHQVQLGIAIEALPHSWKRYFRGLSTSTRVVSNWPKFSHQVRPMPCSKGRGRFRHNSGLPTASS